VFKTATFDAVLHAHRLSPARFFAGRFSAGRFSADRSSAGRFSAPAFVLTNAPLVLTNAALVLTNAALATPNTGTGTGTTRFVHTNAALMITTDLPRIQSSRRSCPRMLHSDTTSEAFVLTTQLPCSQSRGEGPAVVESVNTSKPHGIKWIQNCPRGVRFCSQLLLPATGPGTRHTPARPACDGGRGSAP